MILYNYCSQFKISVSVVVMIYHHLINEEFRLRLRPHIFLGWIESYVESKLSRIRTIHEQVVHIICSPIFSSFDVVL